MANYKRTLMMILAIICSILLVSCSDILPERIGNSYYARYEILQDKVTVAPQLTYFEMFGLDEKTIFDEKERVEKRGEVFKTTCEFYYNTGCFDDNEYEITSLSDTIYPMTSTKVDTVVAAFNEIAKNRVDEYEAIAYETANVYLRYGNEIAEATILFYVDNVIIEDFTGIIQGDSNIIGLVPLFNE